MVLDIKRLNLEYISWNIDNGEGRNLDDLRFGQMLYNKYEMDTLTDVFYIETPKVVYDTLLKDLTIT